jgi:dihydroorotase
VKTPEDREAIRQAAFSGNKKFFFGSDSAPHLKEKKESFCGAAGIYSAPVILPILMQEFEKEDKLNRLANFVAGFGADFYGIARSTQSIRLIRKEWQVPLQIHGVVPLAAGQTLQWSLA